ncbi:transglycosylase domain-containing protein [Mesorhizobium sp. Z1-4]|uniref:transglycosylase domain-containing protein n=1 Tax=Mesorhizobium sp. Z1-4 TaxID=2448478 RepID=UPI000FD77878|nr:transglycosylase domain-containing protein [Mesorhizobium sp. Z1-4]
MTRRKKPRTRIEPRLDVPGRGTRPSSASAGARGRAAPARRPRKKSGSSARSRRRTRRGGGLFGFLKTVTYWCVVLGIWAGIAAAGVVLWYGAQMPSMTTWEIPDRPPNVRIVSVDGTLVANRGMTGGEAVGLHEMSPYIPEAVIAIEDRRFHSHFGIDPIGLARAVFENLTTGRISQGGSTITQQLAKNLFLKPDRTVERKVQEVLLAIWLEHKHSKQQILEMYLNRVYFGSGSYGVEAASRRYFDKPASDVSLSEAALLAGLLKAPSRLSPARDPKAAEKRAQVVLQAMRDSGMIDDSQMTTAMSAPATRATAFWTGAEHYVADKVMEELPGLIGEITSDVVVETTLDFGLQKVAENTIRRLIDENGKKLHVSQGVLVSLDNTGAVRAMVGGYDYANSQFDRATEARRQPGSAFKPFVYMAAVENGMTPDTMVRDAPVRIGKWSPSNFNDKYYGDVSLSFALSRSLNSVAARLVSQVGAKSVIEAAYRMGIESDLNNNASIALGTSEVTPLELTAAYVPFANGGYRPFVHFIEKVSTPEGKVLWQRRSGGIPRVVNARVVGMMNTMMSRTLEEGTGRKAYFGWPAAGKTGTTQSSRDVWFVGFTANLTTGVWFGNDDNSPTKKVTGGSLPAQAWHDYMAAAHSGIPVASLPGWSGAAVQPNFARRDDIGTLISSDRTASIPPEAVGENETAPPRSRVTSILDILLGN